MNATTAANWQCQAQTIELGGEWTSRFCEKFLSTYQRQVWPGGEQTIINAENITELDTVGAWALLKLIQWQEKRGIHVKLQGLNDQQQLMFDIVHKKHDHSELATPIKNAHIIAHIGERTYISWHEIKSAMQFVGELSINFLQNIGSWRRQQVKSFIHNIDAVGFRALPIIGLLTFLIGVVLAYQMGLQLQTYGAQVYLVDLTGISIFREFGPMITAIIVAGRTGSAFTAEIGTMKVNEELDALRTLGIAPIRFVVLPKILGLLVALPLLIIWANIFGVLGGMVIARHMFEIHYLDFIQRFIQNVSVTQLYLGLMKAPFFALVIGTVGCFQGLQVEGGAASVGRRTTKSVVIAIFFIIVVDAVFSILFSWQGL